MAKSIGKSPYKGLTLTKIKITIAALVELVFRKSGYSITKNEIRELFDAFSQDTKKCPIDKDLKFTKKSFDVTLNRTREQWEELLAMLTVPTT